MNVEINKGGEFSLKEMKEIDRIFQNAFPGNERVRMGNKKSFLKDIFFIVRVNGKILSVGRLRPVRITFLKKNYDIQGIADVVSVVRGKGYGKILMEDMRDYLVRNGKTGIGFCERRNSVFYRKCGFKIARDLVRMFVYKNSEGQIIKNKEDDDVIYLDGKDRFMERVIRSKENVLIPCEYW
jgi:GNAT superfamily N-acetyltransferase